MSTKNSDTTLEKVADDEPIFVLRGQDVSSPKLILQWLAENHHLLITNPAKADAAFERAKLMACYEKTKSPD